MSKVAKIQIFNGFRLELFMVYGDQINTKQFSFSLVSENTVYKYLNILDANKATGLANIPSRFVNFKITKGLAIIDKA